MKVRRLFLAAMYRNRLVVEKVDGTYWSFFDTPARTVKELDLTPMKYYRAVGRNAAEAPDYMYKIYGLQKEE